MVTPTITLPTPPLAGQTGHITHHNALHALYDLADSAGQILVSSGADAWGVGTLSDFTGSVSVKSYGAVGDGVTDDTAAIHTARTSAGIGGTIYIPDGTYIVEGLNLNLANQMWILSKNAILKAKVNSISTTLSISASGIRIRGGTIDGNKSNQTGNVTLLSATAIDDFHLEDIIITNSSRNSLLFAGCQRVVLERSTVSNTTSPYGAALFTANGATGCSDCKVTNNHFLNNGGNGVQFIFASATQAKMNNNLISGNTVANCGAVPIEYQHGDDAIIIGNHVYGSGTNGISLGWVTGGKITSNVIKDQSSWGIELSRTRHCTAQGNFIDGSGLTDIGIQIGGASDETNSKSDYFAVVGNTLRNMEQANSKFGIQVLISGTEDSFGGSIIGNVFVDCGEIGIYLNRGATSSDICQGVTISDNEFHLTSGGAAVPALRKAISFNNSVACSITSNKIIADANAGSLVDITGGTNHTITGNTIVSTTAATRGIACGASRCTIEANIVTGISAGTGIDTSSGSLCMVVFNDAYTNSSDYAVSATCMRIQRSGSSDGTVRFFAPIQITDVNLIFSTATGTRIGTASTQKLSFWNAAPIVRPGAYTQTYATADKALAAYTSDPESSTYTGLDNAQAGTPYAKLTDLNSLRAAYETLRIFTEDAVAMLNSVVDDLQLVGLVG